MKTALFLLVLLTFMPNSQGPVVSHDGSSVTVVSFKWFKDRQSPPPEPPGTIPAAAMIPQNKNFERNRRANTSPGERDPNLDTIDGRAAALERAVQESRAAKPLDGFAYQARIHNASAKFIEIIFWEYQFTDPGDAANLTRRQFLCGVKIKPEKDRELKAFTLNGPHDVISVATLAKKMTLSEEKVVINRVEFADGSIWQRPDWNFGEIRLGYARAVATPWVEGECKAL